MSEENKLDLLRSNSLFSGLSKSSLKKLCSISVDVFLKKNECLMQEGEEAHEIFFILEGVLEVVKCDSVTQTHHTINYLYPDDSIGELTLFDQSRRSASVYAVTDAHLLKVSYKDLHKLSKQNKEIFTIYFKLSERTNQRLRTTTQIAATALKKHAEEHKNRAHIGQLFVYSIIILALFAYTTLPLKHALAVITNTAFISIPMIMALSGIAFLIIYASNLPLHTFGITIQDWKKSICEGFLFTLPILLLILLAKWIAIHFTHKFQTEHLFEPFMFSGKETLSVWILGQFVYCLFVPIQELVARGILQGMLERFLIEKRGAILGARRTITAIFISNLVFGAAHLFLSEAVAIVVFTVGLYLGWIYSRTHNLLGVIIAHCLVGVWGLSVVGIHLPR